MRDLSRVALRFVLIAVSPLLLLTTGCSSEGSISGTISFEGKPLTGGKVLFWTSTGSQTADIQQDGTYTIPKIATGSAKIAVDTSSARGPASSGTNPMMGSGMMPNKGLPPGGLKDGQPKNMQPSKGADLPAAMADTPLYNTPAKRAPAQKIPDNYADPEKSGLTYTIVSGPQTHNIDLK